MDERIKMLKEGFGNCVFLSRNPKSIENIIMRVVSSTKVTLFSNRPTTIKVETLSPNTDKITLVFKDDTLVATLHWKESSDGEHYILSDIS